ncbi:MAG: hypothetical protein AB2A00_36525, partial [Myxococcota bacterium]
PPKQQVKQAPPPKKSPPPQQKPAAKPAKRAMTNDEAREAFARATALMRDEDYAAAIKIAKDIVDRAEDGPFKEKARNALPRWQKKMEEEE